MDGLDKLDHLELEDEKKLTFCPDCGATVTYKGLGEYVCDKCRKTCYDDYGKVRVFLEKYPGANIVQVANNTGVSKNLIRRMVDENRFAIQDGNRPHLF